MAMSTERHPSPAGERRLLDLLKNPDASYQARRKMEALEELRGVVRGLQFGDAEKKKKAMAVRKLAKVDVLNWSDSPACQEKASYILMVMAHRAWPVDRQAMVYAGILSAELGLTLIGSTLAQKRASRILEGLRVDKGKQVCGSVVAMSAPQHCSSSSAGMGEMKGEGMGAMSEERWAVKELVQQRLESNIRRTVKRANLPPDFAPSDHFKSLTATGSSKSLPL